MSDSCLGCAARDDAHGRELDRVWRLVESLRTDFRQLTDTLARGGEPEGAGVFGELSADERAADQDPEVLRTFEGVAHRRLALAEQPGFQITYPEETEGREVSHEGTGNAD